ERATVVAAPRAAVVDAKVLPAHVGILIGFDVVVLRLGLDRNLTSVGIQEVTSQLLSRDDAGTRGESACQAARERGADAATTHRGRAVTGSVPRSAVTTRACGGDGVRIRDLVSASTEDEPNDSNGCDDDQHSAEGESAASVRGVCRVLHVERAPGG